MRSLIGSVFVASLAVVPALAADWEPPLASMPAATNPFLGGYAALGGSYGTGSPRSFSVASSFIGSGSASILSGDASPAGWSGIAAGGYNMTFGPALIGIELDGRWGNEKFSKDGTFANSNGIGPAGAIAYNYAFANEAGVHLSGRLGAVFGDTLIFGKLGAGASRIKDIFAADQTGASRCSSTSFVFNPITLTSTQICVGPAVGGAGSFTQVRWAPSLVLGVGAERNVGAFFVRGAVETETFAQDIFSFTQPTANGWSFSGTVTSPNMQWTVRASAMAGVRL